VFGYENQFFAKQLYLLVSNNQPNIRVYFPDYLDSIMLLSTDKEVPNVSFMFKLLDSDGDRELSSLDLVLVKQAIPMICPFALEFNKICEYFIEKNTMT
jgi:hypothetical protein